MSPEDIFRVLNLLLMALGPAFIALIALGLNYEVESIRYANGALFLFVLIAIVQSEIGMRRLTLDQRKILVRPIVLAMQAAFAANALLQLAALMEFIQGAFIILYGGLVLVLAQAVVQFVRLIIARPNT